MVRFDFVFHFSWVSNILICYDLWCIAGNHIKFYSYKKYNDITNCHTSFAKLICCYIYFMGKLQWLLLVVFHQMISFLKITIYQIHIFRPLKHATLSQLNLIQICTNHLWKEINIQSTKINYVRKGLPDILANKMSNDLMRYWG